MRCGFCTTLKYESFPKKVTFVSGQKSPHQTDHLLLSFLEPRGDPFLLIPSHSYLMFAPKIDLTTPFWISCRKMKIAAEQNYPVSFLKVILD